MTLINRKTNHKRSRGLLETILIMTLDEYCGVIADWLMANPKALTVLDYFENNEELFPLSEVLAANDSRIYDVLSERILKLGLRETTVKK